MYSVYKLKISPRDKREDGLSEMGALDVLLC